jgi:hypothetical protein
MSKVVSPRQHANTGMLWVQLLAGPVLWSVHFLLSYLLVEAFCQMGWNFRILGASGLPVILTALTVLAIISASLFGLKSYRAWKNLNDNRSLAGEIREASRWSEEPLEFVYFSGLLLSVLFTAVILMTGIPVLFLSLCA